MVPIIYFSHVLITYGDNDGSDKFAHLGILVRNFALH